ncbi:MAG: putative OPT family oligopeptide transporter [Gammaproteobacteria bacterium]
MGLGTKKFLTDPTLPAPEARACETMIQTAVDDPERRPRLAPSLYLGLAASFLAPLIGAMGLAKEHVVLMKRQLGERSFLLELPMTPIYLGIGGLLTLATALLVFGGAMLRLVGDFMLAGIGPDSASALFYPANSMRWVGGGAMTVAVAYSLVRFIGLKSAAGKGDDPLVEVSPKARSYQWFAIFAGVALLFGWLLSKDGPSGFTFAMTAGVLACCSLMVVLGAILSLQIGSSASPVSGTIFVTTLVLCLVALAVGRDDIADVQLLMPLLVGACVAVCTANDSSQDYKTMQLCGMRVQEGFFAQIIGLCAGCIVVPIVLSISHSAFTLGSPELTAPQGKMFATLITGLLLDNNLPWSPILIGLGIGVAAVAMDIIGAKRKVQLPAMALAVGIYLPAYLGVGILIGSLFRAFGERGRKQGNESILTAAGLITGAALYELVLGSMIVGLDFDPKALKVFSFAEGSLIPSIVGVVGILGLGSILYFNSRPQRER